MEPVSYSVKSGEERILHRCVTCGFERENRVADGDDREMIISIMENASDALFKK